MATELCQKCKQSHPVRACDYDDNGDCAETVDVHDVVEPPSHASKQEERERKTTARH